MWGLLTALSPTLVLLSAIRRGSSSAFCHSRSVTLYNHELMSFEGCVARAFRLQMKERGTQL